MYLWNLQYQQNSSFGVWLLFDYPSPDEDGNLSMEVYQQISCLNQTGWQSDRKVFSGHLGRGKITEKPVTSSPERIAPTSFRMTLFSEFLQEVGLAVLTRATAGTQLNVTLILAASISLRGKLINP